MTKTIYIDIHILQEQNKLNKIALMQMEYIRIKQNDHMKSNDMQPRIII